jgi:anti-sigma factor RsiW
MTCEYASQLMMAEGYVSGKLSEAARDEFEEHYFGCDRCFAEVEALRAVRAALPGGVVKKPVSAWVWALPIAAALLLALFLWPRSRPEPVRQVAAVHDYSALARFDAPVWNPVRLRGHESLARAAFDKAMQSYAARNYAACAQSLHDLNLPEARYYEGISLLLQGKASNGAEALNKAIAYGDTPYREESRYYLAKALLAQGDVAGARDQLHQVLEMRGDLEKQAADLLTMLP